MQHLKLELIKEAKKEKMQKLETEMRDVLISEGTGYMFVCPFCNYSSRKNSKGSAKIFDDGMNKAFKCFNCGIWRRI